MPASAPVHIVCVIGTRPEVIKMAPVVRTLSAVDHMRVTVLCSGQHRDLLAPLAGWFGLAFHEDLAVMGEEQTLSELTSRLVLAFERVLGRERPDLVIAQGDTSTVMCAALCSFYLGIPFAHVEAGLRTGDLTTPFPEEFNRLVADRLARFHFCPTERAAQNLRAEGIASDHIHVTGNTIVDALHFTTEKLARQPAPGARHDVLLTAHRRENLGAPLADIFGAVRELVEEYDTLTVLCPAHPHPGVRATARAIFGDHPRIAVVDPLSYPELVQAMQGARFILTDSGGIQEEAPVLGKPVLVLRRATERPEVVELGVAELVGTGRGNILRACRRLLSDPGHYARMSRTASPYGDGRAAGRIRDTLQLALRVTR